MVNNLALLPEFTTPDQLAVHLGVPTNTARTRSLRKPRISHQVIQRYQAAVELLQPVAHYADAVYTKQTTGSPVSDANIKTFTARKKQLDAALHKVCAFPIAGRLTLRANMRFLNVYRKENSLGRAEQRAVMQSILQMPKDAT